MKLPKSGIPNDECFMQITAMQPKLAQSQREFVNLSTGTAQW
jgi:hypothetical protein